MYFSIFYISQSYIFKINMYLPHLISPVLYVLSLLYTQIVEPNFNNLYIS